MKSVKLKPVLLGGRVIDGYFIEFLDSVPSIWSNKVAGGYRGSAWGSIRKMSIPASGRSEYPKLKFRENGKYINADTHRVIAENLVPFPKPKCLTKEEWANTPEAVKQHIQNLYLVNHIDHDKYNCHPSNLEWVTSKDNAKAYQEHKKANV